MIFKLITPELSFVNILLKQTFIGINNDVADARSIQKQAFIFYGSFPRPSPRLAITLYLRSIKHKRWDFSRSNQDRTDIS